MTSTKEGSIEAQATVSENLPTFTLNNRRGEQTAKGRRETVQLAKTMSKRGGPTQVQRKDGVVNMTFNGGTLIQYKYEPRRRR